MLKKLSKSELIKSVRYSEDNNTGQKLSIDQSQLRSKVINSFLMKHLPVNHRLVPKIYDAINDCLSIIGLEDKVNSSVFIYNSPSLNAEFLAGLDNNNIIIRISSSLIKLLTIDELKFIIGHELGHYIFHSEVFRNQQTLEDFRNIRAREITADRVGLLCCQSVDIALRAIIKMLSGLCAEDIDFDIHSFITEFKEIDVSSISIEELYSTHPPLPIRAKALLLFSMGEVYSSIIGNDSESRMSQKSIDQKVKQVMDRYLDSKFLDFVKKSKDEFRFWSLSLIFLMDEKFDKVEQEIISNEFGLQKLDKLKHFIQSISVEKSLDLVSKNCRDSFISYFKNAPEESTLYLSNFDNNMKTKLMNKEGLQTLLKRCPTLKGFLKLAS